MKKYIVISGTTNNVFAETDSLKEAVIKQAELEGTQFNNQIYKRINVAVTEGDDADD